MFVSCCGVRKEEQKTSVKGEGGGVCVEPLSGTKKFVLETEVVRRMLCFVSNKEWHSLSLLTKQSNFLIPVVLWKKDPDGSVQWKNLAYVIYHFPSCLCSPALQRHYTDRWMLRIFGSSDIPIRLPCLLVRTKKEELGGFHALDQLWKKKEGFFGIKETQIFQATWQSFVPKVVLVWKVTVLWPKKEKGSVILDVWHDYLIFDWDIFYKKWEVRHSIGEEGRPDYSYQIKYPLIPKIRRQSWVNLESTYWIQQLLKGELVGAKIDLRRRFVRETGQDTLYFPDLPMCLGDVSLQHMLDRMSIQKRQITLHSKGLLGSTEGVRTSQEHAIVYRF